MKLSLEWISDYVELPEGVSPATLAHDLTLKTVEVEDVIEADGDVILEIDNKSLTNRPDLWGHYGIARELAAIYGTALRPLPGAALPPTVSGLVGDVDPALCDRIALVTFELDREVATPQWLRTRLARIGEASLGLAVDLTNYVMFAVGQPTHAYDADRVTLPLSVRPAASTGTVELLAGGARPVAPDSPLIWDAAAPVGVAGVMGGATSAIRSSTRSFVLEAATFRPGPVRRAAQGLGLRTEASSRFEKGLDTARVDQAIGLFLTLLAEVAPDARVTGIDDRVLAPTCQADVEVDRGFLTARIGTDLGHDRIGATLAALGFDVADDETTLLVTAPTWRSTGDIGLPHDVLEEVARIHGYDNLPVAPVDVELDRVRDLRSRPLDRVVRETLAFRAGLMEVITYPWTADALLTALGFAKSETVRFDGAPAPDRDGLRPSLLPNLLDAVAANLRYRDAVSIFEVGTVFATDRGERTMAAVALTGADGVTAFRHAVGVIETLTRFAGLASPLTVADPDGISVPVRPWADRSARAVIMTGDRVTGTVGLLPPRIRRALGISAPQVACLEIDLGTLTRHTSRENRFEALAELPEKDLDLSVVAADRVPWAALSIAAAGADPLVHRVSYVDEFRGAWVPDGHRSVTMRITLRPTAATLSADEIGTARTAILTAITRDTGATLR